MGAVAVVLWACGAEAARAAEVPHITHDPAGHQGDVAVAAEFLPGSVARNNTRRDKARVVVDALGNTAQPTLQANPGDIVRVRVRGGTWTVDARSIRPVGVEGHVRETTLHTDWGHRREVGRLPFGRLLLRVGSGPWLDAGAGVPIRTRLGGPLVFQINDRADSLTDNAGAVEVEVTVERTGTPVTSSRPTPLPPPGPGPGPPPAPGPGENTSACLSARTALSTHLRSVPLGCRADDECSLAYAFDPCTDQTAVRSTGETASALVALESLRRAAWESCGFAPRPCSVVPVAARCVASRCMAVTLGGGAPSLPTDDTPEPDRCRGVVCPAGQHCRLHQVQCVRAPCPPLPMCVAD